MGKRIWIYENGNSEVSNLKRYVKAIAQFRWNEHLESALASLLSRSFQSCGARKISQQYSNTPALLPSHLFVCCVKTTECQDLTPWNPVVAAYNASEHKALEETYAE